MSDRLGHCETRSEEQGELCPRMLFPGSDRHTHLHTLTHKIKGERREKSWGRESESTNAQKTSRINLTAIGWRWALLRRREPDLAVAFNSASKVPRERSHLEPVRERLSEARSLG